ncbi:unnamed protein product [Soboliphyme baturini]|uniref:Dihydropteridine reductase n=1 Tax=Soboliphyme baturini TaxID=241478 RepID=A0A183INZ8_9BILA|nr:unnamed protein product [Soboliphyme baturini]
MKQSLWTSFISCRLAALFLSKDGLLVLTGAASAIKPSPGMIGYGVAKSAVHHLTKNMALPESGLPEHATVVAILPVMLDTKANRQSIPDGDISSWTPLKFVSDLVFDWAAEKIKRPNSGSLIQLITADNKTVLETCDR